MVGAVVLMATAVGCRDKKAPPEAEKAPPVEVPALELGLAGPGNFSLTGGAGREPFRAALMARRARDPEKEREALRRTLDEAPEHFDAAWELGVALARAGEARAAVGPLLRGVAADFGHYGGAAAEMDTLAPVRDEFPAFVAAVRDLRARFDAALATGEWVVGQMTAPRTSNRAGPVSLVSGAEVFVRHQPTGTTDAAEAETAPRFIRLSRTGGAVRGLAHSRPSKRGAYVAVRNQWRPTPTEQEDGKRVIMRDIELGVVGPGPGQATRFALGNAWAVELWWASGGEAGGAEPGGPVAPLPADGSNGAADAEANAGASGNPGAGETVVGGGTGGAMAGPAGDAPQLFVRAYRVAEDKTPEATPATFRADLATGQLVPVVEVADDATRGDAEQKEGAPMRIPSPAPDALVRVEIPVPEPPEHPQPNEAQPEEARPKKAKPKTKNRPKKNDR